MLRHYCSFCGKWLSDRSGSLENHLRKAHVEIYQRQKDVRSMCRTVHLVRTSPCGVCSARFSKHTKHQCTMLQHLCYLRAVIDPSEQVQAKLPFPHGLHSSAGRTEHVSTHGCGEGDGTPQERASGSEEDQSSKYPRPAQGAQGQARAGLWPRPRRTQPRRRRIH